MLQGYGTKEGSPFLYLFDSFPGSRTEAIENIRDYLSQEWYEKKVKLEAYRRKKFSADEMALIEPVKPEQDNGYDCGLFLLTYTEKIFDDIQMFIRGKTEAPKNLATWFPIEMISHQRKIIKSTILELAEKQNPSNLHMYRAKEMASNDKYQVWLQNLARAEFHYRRGDDQESGEECDEEEELWSPQLLTERREEEVEEAFTDDDRNPNVQQQHQIAELKYVQSPDQIHDIKDEPTLKGNIWKNRLRSKIQNKK